MELLFVLFYFFPGLFVARATYGKALREISATPVQVIPPKPPRPALGLNQVLHTKDLTDELRTCSLLKSASAAACSCKHRDEWVQVKNQWEDYEEWVREYGHIKNGVSKAPTPHMGRIYASVPFWPLVLAAAFIRSAGNDVKVIDYQKTQELERELLEIEGGE